MTLKISNGKVILGDKIETGLSVYIKDSRILAVTAESLPFDEEYDAGGNYVSPGFIDIHCHGGGGGDFMDGTVDAFLTAAELHAKHGTTTLIPTTLTASREQILTAFSIFDEVCSKNTKGAYMPGFHLEGPYFAPTQVGGQNPDHIRPPQKDEYEEILRYGDKVLRWSSAPELPGTEEFAKALAENGTVASIGHSDAEYDCVVEAHKLGYSLITHLYSCTSTVHRRNAYRYAGIVEAAYLLDDMDVEIIADGKHLPASLLKFVYKFKGPDKIALITDALRGAGFPDGTKIYSGNKENGMYVIIEDGVAKMPDRQAFAGSVTTANKLVRNMVEMAEVPLTDAVKMATATPARIMKLPDRGALREGFFADIVVFDDNIDVKLTAVNGRIVHKA